MNKLRLTMSVWERKRLKMRHNLILHCGLALASVIAPLAWATDVDPRRDGVVQTIERAMPSVVNIGTTTIIETRDPFEALLREMWGLQRSTKQYSIGSGVIIDESGYILTNDHVVRRASEIWVKLADGRERQADRVLPTAMNDAAVRSDVALLKIRARPGDTFTPVKFAPDDDLLLGETVIAMGNPFGLGGSVSRGILSSKNRRPPPEAQQLDVADWLQTDAAINPGNSGGPLINLRGELIGLNVAVYREGQGIGFAIPIKAVTDALAEIFTPERTRGLWFGARVKAVAENQRPISLRNNATEKPNLLPAPVAPAASSTVSRLAVLAVQPGSPAERAGLKVGDIIMQVNGQTPRSFIEFNHALVAAGDERDTQLTVQRGSDSRSLSIRLIQEKTFFTPDLIRKRIGATLEKITPEIAERLGLRHAEGYVITNVDKTGPAAKAQLHPGLIVRGLDNYLTPDLVQTAKLVYGKQKGDVLQLDVVKLIRQGGFTIAQSERVPVTVQ